MPVEAELKQLVRALGIELVEIPDDVNYWLIRTHSGMYYDTFKARNFVGVAWPWEEELFKKTNIKPSDEQYLESLRDHGKKNAAIKIKHFIEQMQIGDIVISPASRSSRVLLGRVTGNAEFYDADFPYVRRRSVRWISEVSWEKIPQTMSKFFLTHHGICSAENIATEIDRLMYPIYIKNDEAYLTLQVRREKAISTKSVNKLLASILDLMETTNLADSSLSLKSELRSPGFIQFLSTPKGVLVIVIALNFLVGGKIEAKYGEIEFSHETNGLLTLIFEKEQAQLKRSIQELDVDTMPFIGVHTSGGRTSSDLKVPDMMKKNGNYE